MFNLTVPGWVADCNPCLSYISHWGTNKASAGQPEEHSDLGRLSLKNKIKEKNVPHWC
jgi:hypothetical protein